MTRLIGLLVLVKKHREEVVIFSMDTLGNQILEYNVPVSVPTTDSGFHTQKCGGLIDRRQHSLFPACNQFGSS